MASLGSSHNWGCSAPKCSPVAKGLFVPLNLAYQCKLFQPLTRIEGKIVLRKGPAHQPALVTLSKEGRKVKHPVCPKATWISPSMMLRLPKCSPSATPGVGKGSN